MRLSYCRRQPGSLAVRRRSANVAIELAIIIPAMVLLMVVLVEGSVQLLTASALQYGLRQAVRFGITGLPYPESMGAHPPASREAAIAQIIAGAGLGLIKASSLHVDTTSFADFTSVGKGGTANSAGGPSAIVQYKVGYMQPWLFGGSAYPPAFITGLPGMQYNLTTVVQNEAFPTN